MTFYSVTRQDFGALFTALHEEGYTLVGPTVQDGAIVYDRIRGVQDLPVGWTDEQEAGHYRIRCREDDALFGYNVGPHAWKKFLQLPLLTLWRARRTETGFSVEIADEPVPRLAFIGVRSCELQAIEIQDRVFTGTDHVDADYSRHRRNVFLVVVQCTQAGNTCFCASMGTGPKADRGFDLAITEFIDGSAHEFLVETGSDAGVALLSRLPHRPATDTDRERAEDATRRALEQMGRRMDVGGIRDLLYRNAEHPRWDDVAARCLACSNCTLVCPTCFCSTVEDVTSLSGETTERRRRWESCFTSRFSYIHGGTVRATTRSRYRQWLTHKLASWYDQFGSSGCVGCGRCITWCPVGIDITEEVAAIRASDQRGEGNRNASRGIS